MARSRYPWFELRGSGSGKEREGMECNIRMVDTRAFPTAICVLNFDMVGKTSREKDFYDTNDTKTCIRRENKRLLIKTYYCFRGAHAYWTNSWMKQARLPATTLASLIPGHII